MEENKTYEATDDELGALLHRLIIVEGNEEVEIVHPIEGPMVVTKASYQTLLESLEKARNMSPAQRILEKTRIENRYQTRFRTAMIDARVHTVDIEDEEHFGIDIEGNQIDMEGLIFTTTTQYPKGMKIILNEIGAFVDESMIKPPIRILKKLIDKGSE